MFSHILLSYDGSEHSRKAAKLAGDLARHQPESMLTIVCVTDPIPREFQEPYRNELIVERTVAGDQLIDEAIKLAGEDLNLRRELLFGDPAEAIIEVAETRQCDLIVMGTRGRGRLSSLLLGSQTQKVISLAHCPVLAVK
jgi:nucleotide-binding universal stress UspA family protein